MTHSGFLATAQRVALDAALALFEEKERLRRRIEAEQLEALGAAVEAALGQLAGPSSARELAYRSLRLELAATMHESEHAAERLLSVAHAAQRDYPRTLEALRAGEISGNHLRVIVDEGLPLGTGNPEADAGRKTAYEAEVLEIALQETVNRLRPIAKRLAAAHSQQLLAERHERALRRRSVKVVDLEDGMADLIAHLSAEDAYAIRDRVSQIAREVAAAKTVPGDEQAAPTSGSSGDEARADVLRDLLLERHGAAAAAAASITGRVQIVVPCETLNAVAAGFARSGDRDSAGDNNTGNDTDSHGRSSESDNSGSGAELLGYGPIDPVTAGRIASTAEAWERIVVDDAGTVLAVDRYRPTPQMRRLLGARDLHCRAPGCRVPAQRCDIDHTVDAAHGGPTSTENLAHLCRGHHVLKHHTDWTVVQRPGGVMKWTSPTGRVYIDRPASRVRFRRAREPQDREPVSGEPRSPF